MGMSANGKTNFPHNVVCDQEALILSRNLREHHDEIAKALNLMALEEKLIEKGLLAHGESDDLVSRTPADGAELVFSRVKEVGSEGYKDLLWCLEQNDDWHIGHAYAAALLRGDTFTDETKSEIEHSIELHQRYHKQLDIMEMIQDNVNTNDLIPSLVAYHLLTNDEMEELTLPSYSRREKILRLLDIIANKGPVADFCFMRALEDTLRENPVHRDILERVYRQPFESIMDVERDSAPTSRRKRKRETIELYDTIKKKPPISIPKQTQAHGIILSEEYFKRINDIRRLHYLGEWDGAEKIVEECWNLASNSETENDSTYRELYVAVALTNCSGYVTRKMTKKVLRVVGQAKQLCKSIDNDNGRVLESKCEWILAKMYRYNKDFDKAMEHVENAQMIHLWYNIAPGEDTTLCNYCKGCILASQLAKTKRLDKSNLAPSPLSEHKASERSSRKFEEAKRCLRMAIDHAAIQDFAIYQSHHMIRLAQLCLHSSQFEAGISDDEVQIAEAETALSCRYIDEKLLAPRTKCLFYVTRSDLYRNKRELKLAEEEAHKAMNIAVKNKFSTEIKSAEIRMQALKLKTMPSAAVHGY